MGMFDWYQPKGALECSRCGAPLSAWQGKDGPCALLLWAEGRAAPTDQLVDEEVRLTNERIAAFRLPAEFVIYSYDCEHHRNEADCQCENGTWNVTRLRAASP